MRFSMGIRYCELINLAECMHFEQGCTDIQSDKSESAGIMSCRLSESDAKIVRFIASIYYAL
jgi:hypothetical protein